MDARIFDEFDDFQAASLLEARWRDDAGVVLQFAGALLISGQAATIGDALTQARETWFSLLADETLGQRAVASPDRQAVAELRLPPSADRSAP